MDESGAPQTELDAIRQDEQVAADARLCLAVSDAPIWNVMDLYGSSRYLCLAPDT